MSKDQHKGESPKGIDEALEVRIVAWLLGEASEFEQAELEAMVRDNAAVRAFHSEMKALVGDARSAHGMDGPVEEDWKLSDERRDKVMAELGATSSQKKGSAGALMGHWPGAAIKRRMQWISMAAAVTLFGFGLWALSRMMFAGGSAKMAQAESISVRMASPADYSMERPSVKADSIERKPSAPSSSSRLTAASVPSVDIFIPEVLESEVAADIGTSLEMQLSVGGFRGGGSGTGEWSGIAAGDANDKARSDNQVTDQRFAVVASNKPRGNVDAFETSNTGTVVMDRAAQSNTDASFKRESEMESVAMDPFASGPSAGASLADADNGQSDPFAAPAPLPATRPATQSVDESVDLASWFSEKAPVEVNSKVVDVSQRNNAELGFDRIVQDESKKADVSGSTSAVASFPVTPATPTAFETDENGNVYPTEYDPPELPNAVGVATNRRGSITSGRGESVETDGPSSNSFRAFLGTHVEDSDDSALAQNGKKGKSNIEVTREFIYPNEYEPPELPNQGGGGGGDKVAVLGDIPVIGRLFRSETEAPQPSSSGGEGVSVDGLADRRRDLDPSDERWKFEDTVGSEKAANNSYFSSSLGEMSSTPIGGMKRDLSQLAESDEDVSDRERLLQEVSDLLEADEKGAEVSGENDKRLMVGSVVTASGKHRERQMFYALRGIEYEPALKPDKVIDQAKSPGYRADKILTPEDSLIVSGEPTDGYNSNGVDPADVKKAADLSVENENDLTGGYNRTRSDMLAEVDAQWEVKPPIMQTPEQRESGEQLRLDQQRKLDRLIVPGLQFEDQTLLEVVQFLRAKSQEIDPDPNPENRGVSIVIDSSSAAIVGGETVDSVSPENIRIPEFSLRNVPLGEAIRYLADVSNMKVKVEDYAIVLSPNDRTSDLVFTRSFRVPVGAQKLFNGASRELTEEYLKSRGVTFEENTAATFDAENGILTVTNTPETLESVETLIEEFNQQEIEKKPAPQIDLDEIFLEQSAADEGVSTFSLHVNDASFKVAAALLENGQWPDVDKVREEEFVNALDYGDPSPTAAERISAKVEQSAHPFLGGRNLVRIGMRTASVGRDTRMPLHLTILLDTSGSMERQDRREIVARSLASLSTLLGENDVVSMIGFSRNSRLLLDRVPGNRAGELVKTAMALPAEGGTNIEVALTLASEIAQRQFNAEGQNRVVMLTDGAANLGGAETDRLMAIGSQFREMGVALDCYGVGIDGLDDAVLEALTRKGDGRYFVLNAPQDADEEFAKAVAGTLSPLALDVKVQVRFNPDRVGGYRLVGFRKQRLNEEDFRNDAVDGGEIAAAAEGNALYQVEVVPDGVGDIGEVWVRFRDARTGEMVEKQWRIPYDEKVKSLADSTETMKMAGLAGLFAESLLKGPEIGSDEAGELESLARDVVARRDYDKRLKAMAEAVSNAAEL